MLAHLRRNIFLPSLANSHAGARHSGARVLRTCQPLQQRKHYPATVFVQSNFPALPFCRRRPGFTDPAGAPTLLLSPFNCIIGNKIRLKVAMFQL
ncbi:hypothetical protein [Janthinobacterium sp. HLX7-2]|uniref:hypothetical protein n=1 Tax=Janthinobacterium sp. HLX7-2 TaxID=1259331 RepID=UPI003F28DA2B